MAAQLTRPYLQSSMAALPLMSYRGVYIEPMPPSASKAVSNKSVLEKVQAIADRHGNNYYVGWPDERLAALPECFRPPVGVVPVLPSKTERRDNKMLTWAYKNNPQFTLATTDLGDGSAKVVFALVYKKSHKSLLAIETFCLLYI